LQEVRWKSRSVVAHLQLDGAATSLGLHDDPMRPMAQRVVHKISERLLDSQRVGPNPEALWSPGHNHCPSRPRPRSEALSQPLQAAGDIDGLAANRQPILVGLGECQQIIGESGQPSRFLGGRPHGVLELLPRAAAHQRDVQLRPQDGERRAQLVACICHERALALESSLVACQHLVQGARQTRQLVIGGRDWEPLPGLAQ
jgi:hypothetical protein